MHVNDYIPSIFRVCGQMIGERIYTAVGRICDFAIVVRRAV